MKDQKNLKQIKINNFNYESNLDKKKAILIAKKYQKKLFIPKLYFFSTAFFLCISFIFSDFASWAGKLLDNDKIFIFFFCFMFVCALISILIIVICGRCPYCHNFQKMNGRTVGVNNNSIYHSKGVSPIINYCNRCGAPLSVKAVNKNYDKLENENINQINKDKEQAKNK